jgi:hypothetical protein
VAVLLAASLVAGCSRGGQSGPPDAAAGDRPADLAGMADGLFRDVTDDSGVSFVYRNGEEADRYSILEVMGGGCAVLDYDGDGLLDLFFPGGGWFDGPDKKQIKGHPPKLYRNVGGCRFEDATAAAGLTALADGQPWFYSHGAAACDYDRDGWPDLLMTGYGRHALWHNEPDGRGGRRFRDVTKEAGLAGPHFWGTSAAWGDLDGDGFPDLYICHYLDWSNENDPTCTGYRANIPRDVCAPRQFGARPHALYRNRGDGTFEDVTRAAGIRSDRPDKEYGKGLGCLILDLTGDGKPDIYVCNDGVDNFLYVNRSEPGRMRFEERGVEFGVARDAFGVANGSMGVDAADFDGTGLPSIWVTNYENEFHALYRRVGNSEFYNDASSRFGLNAIGTAFVGFGTVFVDVDLDGWEDIVVNNGHVIRHSPTDNVRQRPVVFLNRPSAGGRHFVDGAKEGGPYFGRRYVGRGLAVADLDNDGRPDLVFCNTNEPARILRNASPFDRHWVGFDLVGRGPRDVVGARLTLDTGDRKIVRFQAGGRSYLSSSDPRRLFGLGGAAAVRRLTVEWPSGSPRTESWEGLGIDRYIRIEQGLGRPE